TFGQEGRLDVGKLVLAGGDSLHSHDVSPEGASREHQARTDELAVEQNRAGPALALDACVLRTRKPKTLPQHVKETLAEPCFGHVVHGAVDLQLVVDQLAHDASTAPGASLAARIRSRARAAQIPTAWRL